MKSLELIRKDGIFARRLADRIQTLIELGKLDRSGLVYVGHRAVTSAVVDDDGDLVLGIEEDEE
jgi:hypothetical protein